jgi:predicted DNA-binding protein (MmcQ/YjbR family)
MKLAAYNKFCASLPHATHVVQWGGSHVWKIGGKVFAIGSVDSGDVAVSFKCSQMSFDVLREQRGLRPAPYLASRGMLCIQRTDGASMDEATFKTYLRESYRLASLNLTKKVQRELGLNGV